MISKSTLEKAASENLISPEQVEPLYRFIQDEKSEDLILSKDKPLKFVRSFGDVFITLGIVLLVMAINKSDLTGYLYLIPIVGFIALAEWLVRVRKLVYPGIAILISILFFVFKATPSEYTGTPLGFGILSLTSLLFYLRYKMPFSLLPLTGFLVALSIALIGFDLLKNPVIFVGFGVSIFIIAFWFDSRDTQRISHLSDNAFWLYLLASPLIVHGMMISLLTSDDSWIQSFNMELLMIAFFVAFFLLSLLIDRRVMLISTQLYMIYALTQLMQDNASSSQNTLIYILVGLGLFVIYFGTYWYKSRQLIFGFMTDSTFSQYIPDLKNQDISS